VIAPPSSRHTTFAKTFAAASIALFCCLAAPRDARATLGEDLASVGINEQHLGAVHRIVKLSSVAGGERHDLELSSGTVVHEYLSPTGAIYAVTWSGPLKPNLVELLGHYAPQLANRMRGIGHNHMRVIGEDFRLESSGHRRASSGTAWVPSLVPAGVTIGSLE
jgi:hypothetical protein